MRRIGILAALAAGILLQSGRADTPSSGERLLLQPDEYQSLPETAAPTERLPEPRISLVRDAMIWPEGSPRNDLYRRGQWSVSYLSGYMGLSLGPDHSPFSMLPELLRFNRVFNDARPDKLLRGNFEWILELDTLPVVNGPASIVIGGSFMVRYNYFNRRFKRLVIYGQLGGGGMYTDAYLRHSPVLSSGFEFIINYGNGFHYFLTKRLALTAEANYLHFSNGGMVLPNVSVNEVGVLLGFTYFFKRR